MVATMIELWARQVAAMSAWQMLTVIAIATNLAVQVVRLQKMEDRTP
jgi:hypothetical protein